MGSAQGLKTSNIFAESYPKVPICLGSVCDKRL